MSKENYPEHKVEYYFLRISAERFASDLNAFCNDARSFSDEQLFGIVAYSDSIESKIDILKKELQRRVG